jgi:hypothetical protein
MTSPKKFHHTTIANQYHALYSADVFTRIDAFYAEQERSMRECMGNRDNYDLDGVRAVVACWEKVCPNGNAHRVALAVLAERLAELEPQTIDIAFADESQRQEILRIEKRNAAATTMRQLLDLRATFDQNGEGELRDQATDLINAYGTKILRDQDAAAEAKLEADLETWLEDQDAAGWEREQAQVRRAENRGQDI